MKASLGSGEIPRLILHEDGLTSSSYQQQRDVDLYGYVRLS